MRMLREITFPTVLVLIFLSAPSIASHSGIAPHQTANVDENELTKLLRSTLERIAEAGPSVSLTRDPLEGLTDSDFERFPYEGKLPHFRETSARIGPPKIQLTLERLGIRLCKLKDPEAAIHDIMKEGKVSRSYATSLLLLIAIEAGAYASYEGHGDALDSAMEAFKKEVEGWRASPPDIASIRMAAFVLLNSRVDSVLPPRYSLDRPEMGELAKKIAGALRDRKGGVGPDGRSGSLADRLAYWELLRIDLECPWGLKPEVEKRREALKHLDREIVPALHELTEKNLSNISKEEFLLYSKTLGLNVYHQVGAISQSARPRGEAVESVLDVQALDRARPIIQVALANASRLYEQGASHLNASSAPRFERIQLNNALERTSRLYKFLLERYDVKE
jgi:hypothetical protein